MDIRPLSETHSVAPQIDAADMAALAADGYTDVICNRPDAEVGPDHAAQTLRAAVEAAGMRFHLNPVVSGGMSMDNVTAQRAALAAATGRSLAYCRSGTRSATIWALAMAGQVPTGDLIAAGARAGYDLAPMAPQIDAMARN